MTGVGMHTRHGVRGRRQLADALGQLDAVREVHCEDVGGDAAIVPVRRRPCMQPALPQLCLQLAKRASQWAWPGTGMGLTECKCQVGASLTLMKAYESVSVPCYRAS